MGILIENYAARLPVWLAPVKIKIIPIADRHLDYAQQLAGDMRRNGIRVELNVRDDKIGQKIRQAELEKVPYMFVIGDREVEQGEISVRRHGAGDLGSFAPEDIAARIRTEIEERTDHQG